MNKPCSPLLEAKESDNQSEQRIRDAQVIKDAETENACFLKATRDKLKLLKEDNAECELRDINSFERRLVFKLISAEFHDDNLVAISKSVDDQKDSKAKYILVKKLSIGSEGSKIGKLIFLSLTQCILFFFSLSLISIEVEVYRKVSFSSKA